MTTPTPPADVSPTPGWRVGALRGVPVYIGRSWPVVAIVIVLSFAPSISRALPGLGPLAYLVAAAYAVLLLGSVLLHEAGHAIVAQGFGHRVDRIVADLWGGHTSYQAATNSPGRSALVAVAGPAMNALIALCSFAAWPHVSGGVAFLLVGALFYSNAFVAAFNLLPGLPLDGGFLVDSLVWRITGSRTTGQLVAGWTGRIVTIAVVAWFLVRPLLLGAPPDLFNLLWTGLIASFLWRGASAAVSGAHLTRQVDAIDVRTVVAPTLLVRETTSVLDAWSTPGAGTATLVVVDGTGHPLGVVSSTPADVPRERYATTPVSAVMVALPPQAVVEWHEELTTGDVVLAMGRSESPLVLVHWNGQYGAVTDRQIESRLGAH